MLKKLTSYMAYCLSKGLNTTLRKQIIGMEHLCAETKYLYCIWHGQQLLSLACLPRPKETLVSLVSPSKDGEWIAQILNYHGYSTVRGSSSRMGASALRQLIKLIRKGYSVGITPDGPRGPRRKMKSGVAFLGQKTGIQIVPVGLYCEKKWRIKKAWDKFEIPKPFSCMRCVLHPPISIGGAEPLEQAEARLSEAMRSVARAALIEPNVVTTDSLE